MKPEEYSRRDGPRALNDARQADGTSRPNVQFCSTHYRRHCSYKHTQKREALNASLQSRKVWLNTRFFPANVALMWFGQWRGKHDGTWSIVKFIYIVMPTPLYMCARENKSFCSIHLDHPPERGCLFPLFSPIILDPSHRREMNRF